MSTFLFDKIIFGPVWSRRLGESLGINLLPVNRKVCNFNCIYCECGLTEITNQNNPFPEASEIKDLLEHKLAEMKIRGEYLDCITFAGNGEPTLHPDFPRIVEEAKGSRDRFFPKAKIAVLSNATMIGNKNIYETLLKVDLNILKLDSVNEATLRAINCPQGNFNLSGLLKTLESFKGRLIIQTLFLKGTINGEIIDNTTKEEVDAWISMVKKLQPEYVMIYSLARDTAVQRLEKISPDVLNNISALLEKENIKTQVTP